MIVKEIKARAELLDGGDITEAQIIIPLCTLITDVRHQLMSMDANIREELRRKARSFG